MYSTITFAFLHFNFLINEERINPTPSTSFTYLTKAIDFTVRLIYLCSTREENMIPLSLLGQGSKGTVTMIKGNDITRKQILNMGIVPGCEVEVFASSVNNPTLVKINENRIMVDGKTSKRIMVAP